MLYKIRKVNIHIPKGSHFSSIMELMFLLFDRENFKLFSKMPPKSKAVGAKKARAPAKRKLAEEFPPGEVLTDNAKKKWKLGSAVGQGGFGLLYLGKIKKSC